MRLRKKVVWPIKRIIVVARKKIHDATKRIEKAQIVINLSPSMEILQYKDIRKKDAKVPRMNQIDEFIYNEVPFVFPNPFIAGLQEFYLNSYVEEVYENMKVDLGTWQEYKQQIPQNWKTRKRKANSRDLDSIVPRSMVQEHPHRVFR